MLEKVVVDVFKVGFEVIDVEEFIFDDGEIIFCFDVVVEWKLDIEKFNVDFDILFKIVDKYDVIYDGWGIYFELCEEGEYEEEDYYFDDWFLRYFYCFNWEGVKFFFSFCLFFFVNNDIVIIDWKRMDRWKSYFFYLLYILLL